MAVTAPRYKPWKKNRLEKLELTKIYLWLPRWHSGEGSACQCRRCRRPEFHPWAQRSPGAGNSNLLQYSCLKIPWTKEPDKLRSRRSERVRHDRAGRSHTHTHTHTHAAISIDNPQINTCITFMVEQDNIHLLVLALLLSTSFLFVIHFLSYFCIFWCFLLVINCLRCLKWHSGIIQNFSVFLSTKKLWCVLLLMNQHYLSNKTSLKETQSMYWLTDEKVGSQEPSSIFPLGMMFSVH